MSIGNVLKYKGEMWTIRGEFIDSFLIMSNKGFRMDVIPKQRLGLKVIK